jgi:transcriptional antiterminator
MLREMLPTGTASIPSREKRLEATRRKIYQKITSEVPNILGHSLQVLNSYADKGLLLTNICSQWRLRTRERSWDMLCLQTSLRLLIRILVGLSCRDYVFC